MRIQELYNQYCKKEITAEAFLRQVRLDPLMKEFISPVNTINDTILILKQRAGITEQVANEDVILQEKDSDYEDEKGQALPNPDDYGQEVEESYQDEEFYEELDEKYGNPDIRKILADNDDLGFDLPGAAMNAILTHKDWAERWDIQDPVDIDKIRAWRDQVIQKAKSGKRSMNEATKPKVTVDQINPYEYRKGWKYEYENDPKLQKDQNVDKAKEIALKNVAKDPNYYTNLLSKKPGDKEKKAPKKDEKIPAARPVKDTIELKDKAGQMKPAVKGAKEKSNVKHSNKERAKGKPKGVKVMKLKEQIRKELRSILSESAKSKNENLEEGWKSWVTGGLLTLSTVGGIGKLYQIDKNNKEAIKKAKEIFAEPLNKMSSQELSDLEDKVEDKLGGSIKTWSSGAMSRDNEQDSDVVKGLVKRDIENAVTKRPELFGIDKDGKIVFIEKDAKPTNERVTVGDFDTWKSSVISTLKSVLKTDDKAAEKIFNHYKKDFQGKHSSGMDAKTAVKDFTKGLKKVKAEEYEGNTAPEKADFQDVELKGESYEKGKKALKYLGLKDIDENMIKLMQNIKEESSNIKDGKVNHFLNLIKDAKKTADEYLRKYGNSK